MKKLMQVFEPKHIHKTYLVLALTIGTIFSLFMPFFNEPDGQYHLAVSGKVVNNIIDTSRYGEYRIDSGMARQGSSYKNGTRFEKYYLNKAVFIEDSDMPRDIRYSYLDFTFWGHVVPGIGLLIGKYIYPSMGVMITVARLLSVILNSILIGLIIKKAKFGKLIYFAIFLSPVALNSFASLSYDSTGYVAVAFLLMVVFNAIAEQRITRQNRNKFLLGSFFIITASKWNYWFLIALWPILELSFTESFDKIRQKIIQLGQKIVLRKRNIVFSTLAVLGLGFIAAIFLTRNHGGLFYVIQRYLMTFGYNYAGLDLLSNDITSWLAAPYPSQNYIPIWVSAVWYLMIFLVIFSEQKFVKIKYLGYVAFLFFTIGVLGVYYTMLGYNGARTSYIEGVQGRYFTPTLLLLQLMGSAVMPQLNRSARQVVPIFVTLLVIVSNVLLIFDTTIGLIMR
ncbi:DUF2142 domain-containing protein [Streptococcus suis]|uniref:DUF2142 domain-containing protein n=1 Tax=Streptococcus suis TaxID=1307 RepID=UPI001ABE2D9F|nr:DUF2142 domain-containing protein [Streptococcus suis]